MKYIPNSVSRAVAKQVLVAQKHSPTILFVAGVVGVVATTVTACKATLELDGVLQDAEKEIYLAKTDLRSTNATESEYKKDMAVLYTNHAIRIGKLYAPSVALGVVSIGCLAGSHRILTNRNTAVSAALFSVSKAFDEYRARVLEDVGPEKEAEYRYGSERRTIVEDTDQGPKKVQVKHGVDVKGSPYAKFFDQTNKNWNRYNPGANRTFLAAQQRYANDRLVSDGFLMLNDVYDALGMAKTSAGQVVGWVYGNADSHVDFGVGDWPSAEDFVDGRERGIIVDFNVDGKVFDLIDKIGAK